eukprot:COSAG06_NODE_6523_length_2895_cov_63.561516_4_plen_130_part_00
MIYHGNVPQYVNDPQGVYDPTRPSICMVIECQMPDPDECEMDPEDYQWQIYNHVQGMTYRAEGTAAGPLMPPTDGWFPPTDFRIAEAADFVRRFSNLRIEYLTEEPTDEPEQPQPHSQPQSRSQSHRRV